MNLKAARDHQLERYRPHPDTQMDLYHVRCTVCGQTWKKGPQSTCPGGIVYEWGKQPDDLVIYNDLFRKGLTLAEGQKPVAYAGKNHIPLFKLADCVPHGLKIEFDQGKYKFVDTEIGFDIWRENGLCVHVGYQDTYLRVQLQGKGLASFGLYQWQEARADAAYAFADELVVDDVEQAQDYISQALSKRFYVGWRRIIEQIAPKDVLDLQRLMFSSVQGDCAHLHNPDLYTDSHAHTRADLLKYHACRLYAPHARTLDDIAHWRERLAPAVPNKALNKTLDKMPTAVSYRQIIRLSTIQLPQPVTNRLHLIFILCASDHHNWGLHERTVVSATPEMIQQAKEMIHPGRTINARSKTRDIGNLARVILDYPEPYGGDLVGLAQRSRTWHEQMHGNVDYEYFRGDSILPAETPLVAPQNVNFDALAEKGITLLRTAGDTYKEHQQMRHCVHTYASKAQRGLCYLFHVEHETEGNRTQATVEVSPAGEVIQAKGPENQTNAACHYGVKALKEAFDAVRRAPLDKEST